MKLVINFKQKILKIIDNLISIKFVWIQLVSTLEFSLSSLVLEYSGGYSSSLINISTADNTGKYFPSGWLISK